MEISYTFVIYILFIHFFILFLFYFIDPCEDVRCGPNAGCKLINGQAKCLCEQGFTGKLISEFDCAYIDECITKPCGPNAVCRNQPGSFVCECPTGSVGNPLSKEGCQKEVIKTPDSSPTLRCPSGEQCIEDNGFNICVCQ